MVGAMSRSPNQPDAAVAAAVRAELARAGRNQQSLANHLHLSQPAVSRRLSGAVSFSIDELMAIAAYLGIDVAVFVPNRTPAGAVAS